ncbi:hypothetical protein KDL44_11400 [bacterium]|nr:hypothetical protein [bacterium]
MSAYDYAGQSAEELLALEGTKEVWEITGMFVDALTYGPELKPHPDCSAEELTVIVMSNMEMGVNGEGILGWMANDPHLAPLALDGLKAIGCQQIAQKLEDMIVGIGLPLDFTAIQVDELDDEIMELQDSEQGQSCPRMKQIDDHSNAFDEFYYAFGEAHNENTTFLLWDYIKANKHRISIPKSTVTE